nr:MAG TPA: hypothetical protein [Caudoviricetes sp.]DAN66247.1 MAG TPA: hypothetical protein [Caudoviricetes sp.]
MLKSSTKCDIIKGNIRIAMLLYILRVVFVSFVQFNYSSMRKENRPHKVTVKL